MSADAPLACVQALAIFNAVLGNLFGIFLSPLLLLLFVGKGGAVPLAEASADAPRPNAIRDPLVAGAARI